MRSLIKVSPFPFGCEDYAWFPVEKNKLINSNSFIIVDNDTWITLMALNITLTWTRTTEDVMTAAISSIDGLSMEEYKSTGKPIISLAIIITGQRDTKRGPVNSYHANDWTLSAFDKLHANPIPQQLVENTSLDELLITSTKTSDYTDVGKSTPKQSWFDTLLGLFG